MPNARSAVPRALTLRAEYEGGVPKLAEKSLDLSYYERALNRLSTRLP